MKTEVSFLISAIRGRTVHFLDGSFDSYEQAEAMIKKLSEGVYQIQKVYINTKP